MGTLNPDVVSTLLTPLSANPPLAWHGLPIHRVECVECPCYWLVDNWNARVIALQRGVLHACECTQCNSSKISSIHQPQPCIANCFLLIICNATFVISCPLMPFCQKLIFGPSDNVFSPVQVLYTGIDDEFDISHFGLALPNLPTDRRSSCCLSIVWKKL